jgi:hypothetical protein
MWKPPPGSRGPILVVDDDGFWALEASKLGAHSRAQAVSLAYQHDLLDRAKERALPAEHARAPR